MTLYDDYIAWKLERQSYSATDGGPHGPTPGEWQNSDDTAVEMLHHAMTTLSLIAEAFDDNTDYDGCWESCDITDIVAGRLVQIGAMALCREHGAYAAHSECPVCLREREEEMEGPDT